MKKLLLSLGILVLGFGCAKESNNSNTNTAVGVYQLNASGQCIQTSTGNVVQTSYCQQSQVGQQCYGPHSYNGQTWLCGIQWNCSGRTMINLQTNQTVNCP